MRRICTEEEQALFADCQNDTERADLLSVALANEGKLCEAGWAWAFPWTGSGVMCGISAGIPERSSKETENRLRCRKMQIRSNPQACTVLRTQYRSRTRLRWRLRCVYLFMMRIHLRSAAVRMQSLYRLPKACCMNDRVIESDIFYSYGLYVIILIWQADATIASGPEICLSVYEICTFANVYQKTEYEIYSNREKRKTTQEVHHDRNK